MTSGLHQNSTSESSATLSEMRPPKRIDREYQEFVTRTDGMAFVKEPVACVRAQMMDPNNAPYSRVFAWVRLNSWGRFRLWCMTEEGERAKQKDCAAALRIHKGTVSKAIAALEASGMIEQRDGRIWPVLQPGLALPPPEPDGTDDGYRNFIESHWRPSHPELAAQLDEIDAQANALRKARRAIEALQRTQYETWQATGELPPQQLLPGSIRVTPAESVPAPESAPVPSRPFVVAAAATVPQLMPVAAAAPAVLPPAEVPVSDAPPPELRRPEVPPLMGLDGKTLGDGQTEKPSVRPSRSVCTQVRNCLESHMRSFPELAKPDDTVVENIARYIHDQNVFIRFARSVRKTAMRRPRIETWMYFEPVAKAALRNETVTQAPPEPEPPPERIQPQTEEDMFRSLMAAGVTEEELRYLRVKLDQDRARTA